MRGTGGGGELDTEDGRDLVEWKDSVDGVFIAASSDVLACR